METVQISWPLVASERGRTHDVQGDENTDSADSIRKDVERVTMPHWNKGLMNFV
jgi:hypothetical protein